MGGRWPHFISSSVTAVLVPIGPMKIFPRADLCEGKRVPMRIATVQISLLLLWALCIPAQAQEADLEGIRPDVRPGSPEIGADTPDQPAIDAPDDDEEDPLKRLLDDNPIDVDPLDILDTANPLGKVEGLIDEISRNMKEIEELLDDDDTGEQNQSVQQQTLSRIDELITEVQRLTGT